MTYDETQLAYWKRREAEERERAGTTLDGVSVTHAKLADLYADLIKLEGGLSPEARLLRAERARTGERPVG